MRWLLWVSLVGLGECGYWCVWCYVRCLFVEKVVYCLKLFGLLVGYCYGLRMFVLFVGGCVNLIGFFVEVLKG